MDIRRCLLFAFALSCLIRPLAAEIRFQNVTTEAGLDHAAPTAGASWGDFDEDGFPDLWIGNHSFVTASPKLYRNLGNGTFEDVSDLVTVPPDADMHGAAWADFDRDGDLDLVIQAGGGGGTGVNPNLLLQQKNGHFADVAHTFGISFPEARGRTPNWLDANNDGYLDLVFANMPREDLKGPSGLFTRDRSLFRKENLRWTPTQRSQPENFMLTLRNWYGYRGQQNYGSIQVLDAFTQITDLDGDRSSELISYGSPTYIYDISPQGLRLDPTAAITTDTQVSDVAIADFDGDQIFDFYLSRVRDAAPDLVQLNERELRAHLQSSDGVTPKGFEFYADSDLRITVVDLWEIHQRLPPIFIGPDRIKPRSLVFDVSRSIAGTVTKLENQAQDILVSYDPEQSLWRLQSWYGRINVRIFALSSDIQDPTPIEFEPNNGAIPDRLVLDTIFGRTRQTPPFRSNAYSVVAADFDNDMDVDVYLVNADPTKNAANLLLSNDGTGRFHAIPEAGGAAGSQLGRGDIAALADFNLDGAIDIFVTNGRGAGPFSDYGPYELFRNLGNANNWLMIDLVGSRSNRDAIGAHVRLTTEGSSQIRMQDGGIHSFAQNHSRIHFGLGKHETVDELVVTWPDGSEQKLTNVPTNQILKIEEPFN